VSGASIGVLRRVVTYAPASLVPGVLTLVTSMVFTRIFDRESYGSYSLLFAVAMLTKVLATSWLQQSVAKFLPPEDAEEAKRDLKSAILLSIAVMVALEVLFAAAVVVVGGAFLPVSERELLVPAMCYAIVASVFETVTFLLAAEAQAGTYTRFKVVDSVLTLGLRLLLVSSLFTMDISLMFWSAAISNAVLLPRLWKRSGLGTSIRLADVRRGGRARVHASAYARYGIPMTVWLVSGLVLEVGDRYVLNFLLGPAAVGLYDANYRLITGTAAMLVAPITLTLHPYLMSMAGDRDQARTGRAIGLTVENLLILGAFAVSLTAVFHPLIAQVLLGEDFRAGSIVMPVALAGSIMFSVGIFAHKPFEMAGSTGPMVRVGVLAAVSNIVLCFALIPVMGYVGAAYATVAAYTLYAVVIGIRGRALIPWGLRLGRVLVLGCWLVGGTLVLVVLRDNVLAPFPDLVTVAVLAFGSAVLAVPPALSLLRAGHQEQDTPLESIGNEEVTRR
jgi:O-antigen/teichoic acid export membrane protein